MSVAVGLTVEESHEVVKSLLLIGTMMTALIWINLTHQNIHNCINNFAILGGSHDGHGQEPCGVHVRARADTNGLVQVYKGEECMSISSNDGYESSDQEWVNRSLVVLGGPQCIRGLIFYP